MSVGQLSLVMLAGFVGGWASAMVGRWINRRTRIMDARNMLYLSCKELINCVDQGRDFAELKRARRAIELYEKELADEMERNRQQDEMDRQESRDF